jgi:hypothetical protein
VKKALRNSVWFLGVYSTVFIIWRISIPGVTSTLYAEDGQIYLSDAINSGAWNNILKTYAGYIDVPARLSAAVTTLFPIKEFALVNTLVLLFWITLCTLIVFYSAKRLMDNNVLAVCCSAFFVFNPAGRFESSGNLTNLHFFLMATASILMIDYLKNRKLKLGNCIFIFLCALSTPLVSLLLLLAFPVLAHWRIGGLRKILSKRSPFPYLISGSVLMFAVSFTSLGQREPNGHQNVFKVVYLTMDRIFGVTFVPGWGSISGAKEAPQFTGLVIFHNLTVRVILGFLVGLVLLVLVTRKSNRNRPIALSLVTFALTYCFIIGFFYNLEPRYTVLPTFMVFLAFLVSITRTTSFTYLVLCVYVILLFAFSSVQSGIRTEQPSWSEELKKATRECRIEMQATEKIKLTIPPADKESRWHVLVPCSLT